MTQKGFTLVFTDLREYVGIFGFYAYITPTPLKRHHEPYPYPRTTNRNARVVYIYARQAFIVTRWAV